MISYNKVLEIFKKTKINIKNEIVSSKYAVNRISASNITSQIIIQLQTILPLMDLR